LVLFSVVLVTTEKPAAGQLEVWLPSLDNRDFVDKAGTQR